MSDSEETANKTQTPAPSATAGTQSTISAGQTTPTNNLDSLLQLPEVPIQALQDRHLQIRTLPRQ